MTTIHKSVCSSCLFFFLHIPRPNLRCRPPGPNGTAVPRCWYRTKNSAPHPQGLPRWAYKYTVVPHMQSPPNMFRPTWGRLVATAAPAPPPQFSFASSRPSCEIYYYTHHVVQPSRAQTADREGGPLLVHSSNSTGQDRTGQGARLGAEPALRHTLPLRSVTMSCDSAPRLGQEHPTLPVLTATPPFTANPPTYPSSSSEPPTRCEMARSVRHVRKSECEEEKSLNFLPTTQPQPAGHKESQAPDEQVRRFMAMQDEECLYCVVTHKVLAGRLAPTSCLSPRPLVNTQAAAS